MVEHVMSSSMCYIKCFHIAITRDQRKDYLIIIIKIKIKNQMLPKFNISAFIVLKMKHERLILQHHPP